MASVTFPKNLGGDGNTYTDDADPDTGLDGAGYTVRFIPALQQGLMMAKSAKESAAAAFASQGAAKKSADESAASAQASQQAQQDSAKLYGSLQAVDTARTDAQQAATTAGQQRTRAETARKGAESAQSAAESAASQSQQTAGQAVKAHEDKDHPHSQYALKKSLGEAASRGVVGGSGAVMVKGFNGLGGEVVLAPDNDMNKVVEGGMYGVYSSTLNVASNDSGSVVWAQPSSSSHQVQVQINRSNGVLSTRTKSAGVWGGWDPGYSQANILGAVSHVNGVPTGGIIEYGENSNGSYTKLAGGLLINSQEYNFNEFKADSSPSGNSAWSRSDRVDPRPWAHPFGSGKGLVILPQALATNSTNVFIAQIAGGSGVSRPGDQIRIHCPYGSNIETVSGAVRLFSLGYY